ncbi:MAG: 5-formyltetrahydrofolate cyclo-ligase, partial [Candidatus Competibacterales bacterium]
LAHPPYTKTHPHQLTPTGGASKNPPPRGAARAVSRHPALLEPFVSAHRVAGYFAVGGELDPAPLLALARQQGKATYLPVIEGDSLQFAPVDDQTPWTTNRFGIPEPAVAPSRWLAPRDLDLVLTPLVAFDDQGQRLGMGGGFYDRSFSFLHPQSHPPVTPLLLGLAYEFQRHRALICQPWDIPLAGVVTDVAVDGAILTSP